MAAADPAAKKVWRAGFAPGDERSRHLGELPSQVAFSEAVLGCQAAAPPTTAGSLGVQISPQPGQTVDEQRCAVRDGLFQARPMPGLGGVRSQAQCGQDADPPSEWEDYGGAKDQERVPASLAPEHCPGAGVAAPPGKGPRSGGAGSAKKRPRSYGAAPYARARRDEATALSIQTANLSVRCALTQLGPIIKIGICNMVGASG